MITNLLTFVILVAVSGCRSTISSATIKEATLGTNNQGDGYETVNMEPQFADDEDHFLAYWAVWKHLTPQEESILNPAPDSATAAANNAPTGSILSQREIHWTVDDCSSGARINTDGEKIWYLDELIRDQGGQVKPIKEAPRPGYRYFTMLNLNSQHLRGVGMFVAPKKERGETMENWDKRRHKAYLEWLKRSWAKGTKGHVYLTAEHRLYKQESIAADDKWIKPEDYPQLTGELLQLITKYSPKQWPIYFDERAHKPHSFTEPSTWKQAQASTPSRQFHLRFDWDWCDVEKPVHAEIFVPRGEMPPGGPNRPGRADSGQRKIKITEY